MELTGNDSVISIENFSEIVQSRTPYMIYLVKRKLGSVYSNNREPDKSFHCTDAVLTDWNKSDDETDIEFEFSQFSLYEKIRIRSSDIRNIEYIEIPPMGIRFPEPAQEIIEVEMFGGDNYYFAF